MLGMSCQTLESNVRYQEVLVTRESGIYFVRMLEATHLLTSPKEMLVMLDVKDSNQNQIILRLHFLNKKELLFYGTRKI